MKETTKQILVELVERYPMLQPQKEQIEKAFLLCQQAYQNGKKLMVCGNGGSAADAEHIVGELMKCFKKKRAIQPQVKDALGKMGEEGTRLQETLEGSLRAIALTSHEALTTAFSNDRDPAVCFAQQLYGFADAGDVLVAISTSGNLPLKPVKGRLKVKVFPALS